MLLQGAERDTKRIIDLCRTLSEYLRTLLERQSGTESCVFVGAYCTKHFSKYHALSETLAPPYSRELLRELRELPRRMVFNIGFHLGDAYQQLKTSTPKDAATTKLISVIEQWPLHDKRNIFDVLDDEDMWEVVKEWLQTLEYVEFKNSLLRKHFTAPHYTFITEMEAQANIAAPDALFRYGLACERLVFPLQQDLHLCWLTERGADSRWAVCLWCSRVATRVLNSANKYLEEEIVRFWDENENKAKLTFSSIRENMDSIESFLGGIESEARAMASGDVAKRHQIIENVLQLRRVFRECHDHVRIYDARIRLAEERKKIVEQMDIISVINIIKG
jgi:hypothetical protein